MLTHEELEAMPMALEKLFKSLEDRIMKDIVRRLKANCGEVTRAADWQIYRSAELGKAMSEIRDIVQKSLKLSNAETDKIFEEAAKAEWARSSKLYESIGGKPIAYSDNDGLQQLVSAIKTQTAEEYVNITQTMGVATANKGRIQTVSLTEYYKNTLDNAALDVASGAFDYNSVLRRTVRELANSGIRTISYDSVSKRSTTTRIDAAARRALLTGVNQLSGKISEENAKKLGTDMYEVSAHSCCRPSHLDWQGKWYTMAQLKIVCRYGEADGLKGPNCGHNFDAVIPGISVPTYTDEELKAMKEKELEKHEYNGKEYTLYEASQRQRRLERTVSSRLHSVDLLQSGGASEETIEAAKLSAQAASQEYTRFSKAMGLSQQRERIQVGYESLRSSGKVNPAPKPIATDTKPAEISVSGVDISSKNILTNSIENGIIRNKQITDAIETGKITKTLNHEKQAPHMLNLKEYDPSKNKSYFTISEEELQLLIDKHYGTGEIDIGRNGIANAKEYITVDKIVGHSISSTGEDLGETNRFRIHYSKIRTHAVPTKKKENGQ